jgi:eukaryotic-like serine/threonine-protein kinase
MEENWKPTPELIAMLALAMETTRIAQLEAHVEAERQQRKLADTLRAITGALNASLELPVVLDRVLSSLAKIVPYDSAALLLREGGLLHFVAARGFPKHMKILGTRVPLVEDALFDSLERKHRPIVIADVHTDPRWMALHGTDYIRSWIGVPLLLRGELIGALTVDSCHVGRYSEADADLAFTFADQAVIAIENARLFEETRRLAITDGLTGIFNRRHFFALAETEFSRTRRYQHPLSALMIDIDHFKAINDSYGHATGDEVLRQVAQRCQESLRAADILGRYGGEEFAVLLPESDANAAHQAGERLGERIASQSFAVDGGNFHVTVSIGVATADANTRNVAALLDAADQALYAAKHGGRNRVV